jgi:hypothetical protein
MKKLLKILRPVLLIAIGLLLAIVSAVTSPLLAIEGNVAQGALLAQPTVTPTAVELSEIGSTDGIVLMAIFIVLVVIVPVIIWRRSWAR